ncbi:hypothetical protein MYCTH_2311822 [Thermothelomyces thermophilus ATCC 42464]|uniref:Uncharacterized protein n=1 Tax=Thermothelomyces thermophilus (strain ATCC 42464 / BCRC 31852 / DSM 1799) TaxID=573729 RepID=G2QPP2_THET4|nr:uncharacterized protein MYCTH_2311822 [Thermothelomyces thermophilus ATCC 42464]AEO61555.1 hypothetical protein MYCTH_2311822 [Thermothelomyces thermophilus ATCC 42464]
MILCRSSRYRFRPSAYDQDVNGLSRQQLEKSEQEKYDLQRRLKLAESGGAFAAHKAATDQIIKNLQRENAMITTAWYDLTSRLQSNHVVLQRRHDAPRSWLNKQRQMVNGRQRITDPPPFSSSSPLLFFLYHALDAEQ